MSDTTPCYAGYCPVCGGMVAVTVADIERPESIRRAVKTRLEWERAGLTIKIVPVSDIHGGALTGHVQSCTNDKRKRRPKTGPPPSTEMIWDKEVGR